MMLDCSNFSSNNSPAEPTEISNSCALFDFSIYTIVVGTFCVLGILGNCLSFAVMLRDTSRSPTTFLLQALAVADSLVLLAAIPLYTLSPIYSYTGFMKSYYDLHMSILPFLWPIYFIPYTGTIFLTVLVSLNRYEAVCKPFKAAKMSGAHAGGAKVRFQVGYIAIFSIIYNIPRFFEYNTKELCSGPNTTKHEFGISDFGENRVYRIVYANALYFVVMHGGPLISLCFLNANLIRALKIQAKKKAEMKKTSASNHHQQQHDVTLVLIVVVFVFILCQTPTFIDHILWTFLDETLRWCGHWHYYYTAIGDMLAILNSSVNFVIYVLTSPKFRQTLMTMCACYFSTSTGSRMVRIQAGKTETILLCQQGSTAGDTV